MKNQTPGRLTALLAVALLSAGCNLQIMAPADQGNATAVTATPEDGRPAGPELPTPTLTVELTESPAATFTPSLTPTLTAEPVTMKAGQALSCVTGPDWKLYEWVAGIAKDETVVLVARAVAEIPDYYVASIGGGEECWAYGGSSAISGPAELLPVRETPPLPVVSFVVRNRVYIDLIDVYIRPAGDSSWGPDRLTIPTICPGLETTISITAGYYDVRILDTYSSALYEVNNRAIGPDDTYRILEVATDVDVSFQNGNPFDICRIEVMPPGGSWEKVYDAADGGGPIHHTEQRPATLRAGEYQFRKTGCPGPLFAPSPLYISPGISIVLM